MLLLILFINETKAIIFLSLLATITIAFNAPINDITTNYCLMTNQLL